MSRQVDELERRLRPGAPRSSDDEVERLAAVAEDLRAASPLALVPRQAFRDGLRSRLLAEATELGPARAAAARAERETVVAGAAAAEHRPQVQVTPKDGPGGAILSGRRLAPFWRLKRLVAGLSIAALLGTGAAAVASTGALPGDALYGLKRAVEDVRLQLAGSDASKGATALDHARERLEEAEDLALSAPGGAADADSPELRQTLADFSSSSEDGIRLLLQGYADDGDPAALVRGRRVRPGEPAAARAAPGGDPVQPAPGDRRAPRRSARHPGRAHDHGGSLRGTLPRSGAAGRHRIGSRCLTRRSHPTRPVRWVGRLAGGAVRGRPGCPGGP